MKKLKEAIKNIMKEESEYQTFFKKALEKSGKSIPQMSDEEKKAFFNKIDAAWDGKGEKNEELVGKQHKLDIDGDGEIEASDLAALRAGKKKDESTTEQKIYLPNSMVDQIKQSIKMGFNILKVGMISPKKKGVVLINKDYQARGKYPLEAKDAIEQIIRQTKESVNEATHTFTSGQWVAWHNTPKGKKYYNTFKSGKAAQDWALKNNGGAMPKKDWDEQEAKYAVESVNEEMDTITKEKWAKTHKDYKMMRNGVPYILKMVNGATTLVPVKIVKETQTVSENFSSSDIEKIKGAVEGASSFMGIGAQLKKLGMKYDFSTSPLPVYMIKKGAKTFVLVNKKYAEDPQFVVGDTAGGLLEGKINEGKDVKASTVKAGDKISLSDKYNPSGINTPFTVKSIEKKDGYITFKGDSPKNVLKVKETSPVALHESKINEGNAFGAAVTKAKKEGLKEFEFNGKKYKVKKGSYEKNESAKKLAEKSEAVTKK
jgi:hypothetical protein